MIRVTARSTIKEEHLPKALTLYKELEEKSQKEAGCISYQLWEEEGSPCNLVVLEEWESMDSLKVHMKTPHFLQIGPLLEPLKQDSSIQIYKKVF